MLLSILILEKSICFIITKTGIGMWCMISYFTIYIHLETIFWNLLKIPCSFTIELLFVFGSRSKWQMLEIRTNKIEMPPKLTFVNRMQ